MKRTDGGAEGCVLIFSCKNTKIAPSCWTTIDMRMWDTTKERYLTPWAKEKPQQDGRRGEITFKIKSHTRQRCLEGTNKTSYAPGSRERSSDPTRDWARPAFECLSVSWGDIGQQWPATGTGALRAAFLGSMRAVINCHCDLTTAWKYCYIDCLQLTVLNDCKETTATMTAEGQKGQTT